MPAERLCIYVRNVSFPANEMGRHSHANGITVNKTNQTVESAAPGGAFPIDVDPALLLRYHA
jgi:starch synthase (maltosyl-transferring)